MFRSFIHTCLKSVLFFDLSETPARIHFALFLFCFSLVNVTDSWKHRKMSESTFVTYYVSLTMSSSWSALDLPAFFRDVVSVFRWSEVSVLSLEDIRTLDGSSRWYRFPEIREHRLSVSSSGLKEVKLTHTEVNFVNGQNSYTCWFKLCITFVLTLIFLQILFNKVNDVN